MYSGGNTFAVTYFTLLFSSSECLLLAKQFFLYLTSCLTLSSYSQKLLNLWRLLALVSSKVGAYRKNKFMPKELYCSLQQANFWRNLCYFVCKSPHFYPFVSLNYGWKGGFPHFFLTILSLLLVSPTPIFFRFPPFWNFYKFAGSPLLKFL